MIFTIFFTFLIIGGIAVNEDKPRGYLFFIMLFLWIIIGMRDITIGPDTQSYVNDFNNFCRFNFSQMINEIGDTKEPLYIFISWLPSCISANYPIFLLTWALFPVISLFIVFKNELKDAKDYLIAIIVFFLLGLFVFYVAGIRQTAALSLVLIAYKYFKEIQFNPFFKRKNICQVIAFALLLGMAYTIHNSAIVFLCAFLVRNLAVRWWYLLIAIGAFFLANVVNINQVVIISQLFFEDRFAIYGTTRTYTLNTSSFIMQLALFLICFVNKDRLIKSDESNRVLFNLVMVGLIFQSLSGMLAEFTRVSFYFSMFYMILVPHSLQIMPKNIKNKVYVAFILISLIYLFFITSTNLPEYKFS